MDIHSSTQLAAAEQEGELMNDQLQLHAQIQAQRPQQTASWLDKIIALFVIAALVTPIVFLIVRSF